VQKSGVQLVVQDGPSFVQTFQNAETAIQAMSRALSSATSTMPAFSSVATGATTATTSLKSAQIEATQALTNSRTASANASTALSTLRTAQTETATETTKLKTAQTETATATTALKTAQIQAAQASTQLKTAQAGVATETAKLRTAQTETAHATTGLKTAQTETATATAGLKTKQAELVSTTNQLKQSELQLAQATTGLKTEKLALNNALTQSKLHISNLKAAQVETTGTTGGLSAKISSLAGNFGPLGQAILNPTTAIAGLGIASVKMAGDFDSAMRDLQVATGVTDRNSTAFKELAKTAQQVGADTKFSATEAAQGMAAFAQSGLNAKDSMTGIAAAAKVATINHTDLASAAKTGTVAMNAFGLKASELNRIFDVQTKAAALGVLNFNDFQQALASVGSVAKTANQDLESTTSVLLALTNNGQSASDAGTSVKSALLAMINPSKDARKSIEEMGLKIYDAHGQMLPFADIVAQIEKNTRGWTDAQRNQALANMAGSDGIRAFTGALNAETTVMRDGKEVTLHGSEALKEYDRQLRNSKGSADDAAKVIGEGFNAKVEKLMGSLGALATTIGNALLPALTPLIEGLTWLGDNVLPLVNQALDNLGTYGISKATEGIKAQLREMPAFKKAWNEAYEAFNQFEDITHKATGLATLGTNASDAVIKILDFTKATGDAKTMAGQFADVATNIGIKAFNDYGHWADTVAGQLSNTTKEVDRLKKAVSENSQAMSAASSTISTLDGVVGNMSPKVQDLWKEFKNYTDIAQKGGDNSKIAAEQADNLRSQLEKLDPKTRDLTSAFEIENKKLQDATTAFQDNTISMALNEGKAKDLANTFSSKTVPAVADLIGRIQDSIPKIQDLQGNMATTTGIIGGTTGAIGTYNATQIVSKTAVTNFGAVLSGVNSVIDAIWKYNNTPVYSKNAQAPSAYAIGTAFHPGGPAFVGEVPEIIKLPNGKSLFADRPYFLDLPRGTAVTPVASPQQIYNSYNSQAASSTTINNNNSWNVPIQAAMSPSGITMGIEQARLMYGN
jgi:TP901 family phage tail tape measure protein